MSLDPYGYVVVRGRDGGQSAAQTAMALLALCYLLPRSSTS